MFDSTRHPALWAGLMGVCLGVGMGITLDRIHLFDVAHAQMCCSQFDVPLNQQLESEHAYSFRQEMDRNWTPYSDGTLYAADPCKR